MKRSHLLSSALIAIAALTLGGCATTTPQPLAPTAAQIHAAKVAAADHITFTVGYLKTDGSIAPVPVKVRPAIRKWIAKDTAAGEMRFMHAVAGTVHEPMTVQIVSVPYPGKPINGKGVSPGFEQSKANYGLTYFVPLVHTLAGQHIANWVTLEVRVIVPEKPMMVFHGQAQTETLFHPPWLANEVTAFFKFVDATGGRLMPKALDQALDAAAAAVRAQGNAKG